MRVTVIVVIMIVMMRVTARGSGVRMLRLRRILMPVLMLVIMRVLMIVRVIVCMRVSMIVVVPIIVRICFPGHHAQRSRFAADGRSFPIVIVGAYPGARPKPRMPDGRW